MKTEELHNIAMSLVDEALHLRMKGESEKACRKFSEAFNYENDAVSSALKEGLGEPSTSILIMSAAYLAYDAKLLNESEKMIGLALSRELSEEIREQVKTLYDNINFSRHLDLHGIVLQDNEVQISLAGDGVASGMIREDVFFEKLSTINKLFQRSAERKENRPFRKKGRPASDITDRYCTFLSSARAGSYAVTLRIGGYNSPSIDSFQSAANTLIEDVLTNLSLVDAGDMNSLIERIPDMTYLENFVNLSKELAPDGSQLKLVGLTYIKNGQENPVPFKRKRSEFKEIISEVSRYSLSSTEESQESVVEEIITGVLSGADSPSGRVLIREDVQKSGRRLEIQVPAGLTDIVKTYYDDCVSVLVKRNIRTEERVLVSIDLVREEELPSLFCE